MRSPRAVAAICKKRSKHGNQIQICHLGLLYLVDHSAAVSSHSALQTPYQPELFHWLPGWNTK